MVRQADAQTDGLTDRWTDRQMDGYSLVPRPHPPGERVWLHNPEFLGLAEVPKPCNCRCKNAKWFALKHESHHHTIAILAMAESHTCIFAVASARQIVNVKQRRNLNPPGLPTKLFKASSASSSTLHSQKYSDVCQKDFQKLEKALMAYNTYQAILLEMKLVIGVVEGVDDSMSESDMSIAGGTESSSLSGVSKLPEGEASPSAVPDRRTAVVTLGR